LIVSLERALAGFGQIVMLTGTAGSGKTRLLQAFAESVTWRGVHTFWGAGTNSHPGKEPYHPLANALRQAYRSPLIGEHPSDRTAQLYQRLTSPTHMATRSVGSAVPDNGLTPDEFADLLALLGERMPCVLLLDHLEQATAAFWPALIAAAHTLIGKPVLIILAYREAALRSIPNAWSSVIALDTAYAPLRLELGELSYDACAELIVSYRLGLSQAEMTALYHKTGGHPATLIKHLDAQRTGDLGSSQNTRADQPVVQLTLLARLDAPLGRRLTDAERVQVRWTVDAGDLDATLARQLGNITLRRQRVARLIAEAINQGGLPTDADLAQALGVTERTIRADIASLRQSGMEVSTRRRADTLRKQHNSMDLRG
jgi:hypothetical protein